MGYSTAQQVKELLKASNLPQVFSSELLRQIDRSDG